MDIKLTEDARISGWEHRQLYLELKLSFYPVASALQGNFLQNLSDFTTNVLPKDKKK